MVLLYKPDEVNYAIFGVYLKDYFPFQVVHKKKRRGRLLQNGALFRKTGSQPGPCCTAHRPL